MGWSSPCGHGGRPFRRARLGKPALDRGRAAEDRRATAPLWRQHGVEPTSPGALFDHLYLDTCPPILQARHAERVARRQTLRFQPFDSGHRLPPWLDTLGSDHSSTSRSAPCPPSTLHRRRFRRSSRRWLRRPSTSSSPSAGTMTRAPSRHCQRTCAPSAISRRRSCSPAALSQSRTAAPDRRSRRSRSASRCSCCRVERRASTDSPRAASNPASASRSSRTTSRPLTVHDALRALLEDSAFRTVAEQVRASIDAQPDVTTIVAGLETLALQA